MSEIVCITFKTHQTIIGEVVDKGITFNNNDILTTNTPVSDLLAQYRKMFSRIEIAPPGLVV